MGGEKLVARSFGSHAWGPCSGTAAKAATEGLIAAVDPLCDFDDYVVVDVESEFECELDPALFRQGAFRDLVDAVVKARNTVHT